MKTSLNFANRSRSMFLSALGLGLFCRWLGAGASLLLSVLCSVASAAASACLNWSRGVEFGIRCGAVPLGAVPLGNG